MPSWQPNRERVVFDHAAASAAVAELRSSAARLRSGLDFAFGSKPSEQSLVGRWAVWVGTQVDGLMRGGGGTATSCLLEAARIEAAGEAADAEQSRRDRSIAQWEAEDLAERKAAAEAARVAEEQRQAQARASAANAAKPAAAASASAAPSAAAAVEAKPALIFAPVAQAEPVAAVETTSSDSGSVSDDYWF
jgi:hypothetical protein